MAALRRICEVTKRPFDAEAMTDIYDHPDTYRDMLQSDTTDYGERQSIMSLLRKMTLAQQYRRYKKENRLLDFQDLLLLTYDTLVADAH